MGLASDELWCVQTVVRYCPSRCSYVQVTCTEHLFLAPTRPLPWQLVDITSLASPGSPFVSDAQPSPQAPRLCHPASVPAGVPAPASQAGSLVGCLPDGSWHVGLLAQFLSWAQTGGSGKVGPPRAGLGQLHRVNGRHLPRRQEKGSWVHPGEGGAEGRGRGQLQKGFPLASPCSCSGQGTTALAHGAPHGFFSMSSSVIMNCQVLKEQIPCKAQSSAGSALAPPGAHKEVSRFWDYGWPVPASQPAAGLTLLHTMQTWSCWAFTHADTLIPRSKRCRAEG